MLWLLEKDTFEENLDELMEVINSQGYTFDIIEHIPFGGTDLRHRVKPWQPALFYGSLGLASIVLRDTPCVVWRNLPHFECSYYYTYFGKYLLNQNYIMLPFGELIRQKNFIFDKLGHADTIFIRPSSGFKYFTGKVVYKENFELEVEKFALYDIDPFRTVVVSEPRNIAREWRLVVIGDKVLTASQYRCDGEQISERGAPDEVIRLGNEIAKVWQPDPAWVMDICQTVDGELKLIEINSFSCSGFYDCDKKLIVEAASKLAEAQFKESLV